MELYVEDFSVDEIVKLLTSNENGIFSTSKNAIFAGTAEGTVRENLSTLKECIQKNIAHYSENDKEQLTEVVQTEIKVSSGAVLYAYDELPDYSEEQIANYVSYYTTAENKLKKICCWSNILLISKDV